MKKIFVFILSVALAIGHLTTFGQDKPVSPTKVTEAIYHDVFGPLSDIPAMDDEALKAHFERESKIVRNKDLKDRIYPFAHLVEPPGPDPIWQREMGTVSNPSREILQNFAGQSSTSNPPDCNGTTGPNHYMQTINVTYNIYDKEGTLVAGPTPLNSLFSGVPGSSSNDGDPIVIFDEQANKWMVAEFSGIFGPDYMMVAVSQTDDPTGLWDRWSWPMTGFPDYMKLGVWRDGYYMGTNTPGGSEIYAFERDVMIAGGSNPKMVQFSNPWRPNSGFHCVLPVDNDGAFAPEGTPGMFMTINDNAWGGGGDEIWVYELDIDWANTTNSTFNRTQQISVDAFDTNFGSTWDNIPQPGTGQKLDGISQILMHRVQYRNFSSTQNIVCNHTVDVDGTDHAGIRWYELEHNGLEWEVRQSGTYAPDSDNRWMGSIAMNGNREIALGYSVSSYVTYPSIRFTGQSFSENSQASGLMDVTETSILEGTSSQTSSNRWGDYSNLNIDPTDDITFWFTTQYAVSNFTKGTQVASFTMPAAPDVDFVANDTLPSTMDTVYFTDLSTGSPFFWSWSFTPTTVTFLEGTTGSSQNPIVRFDSIASYTIELTATNSVGPSTLTKTDYIQVGDALMVSASADPDIICEEDTTQLMAAPTGGSGTYTYSWYSNPAGFSDTTQGPMASPLENTMYYVEVNDGVQTTLDSVSVTVNPLPEITLGEWPEYICNTDDPIQLTATPEGGVFSGSVVTAEGIFDPAEAEIGWNMITYTYEDASSCVNSAMDSIFVDNCTGIGDSKLDGSQVSVFPNPTNGSFKVESESLIDRIEIISRTGQLVYNKSVNAKDVHISSLQTKGLYIVRIYTTDHKGQMLIINKEIIIQ